MKKIRTKHIRTLKELLFYAGVEKEEYDILLPVIYEENRVLLRVFSLLASGMFFALYLASICFGGFASSNSSTYLFFGAEMVILLICAHLILPKHPAIVMVLVYLFEIMLYTFGIHISMLHAEMAAVSAVAFLLVTPLLFYDRPIREITIRKIVDGQNLETAGYTFSVRLTLEGSAMRGYDAVGDGLAADTTNSAGIIEFKLGDSDEKTLRIPWDAVIEITENEYAQCSVQTESAAGIADLDTENDRIYRCTVDSNDTITFTNKNLLLTVTKQVTGGFGDTTLPFAFTLSGLTAGKIYHLTVAGRSVTRTASSDGTVVFELRHGEQMSIPLIEGSTVTVSETEVQDYTTSLAVNGGESEEASAKTVTLNEATTVDFTNYRPPVAPTGVDFDSKPYVMILALGGLLAVAALSMRRRRRGGDA